MLIHVAMLPPKGHKKEKSVVLNTSTNIFAD